MRSSSSHPSVERVVDRGGQRQAGTGSFGYGIIGCGWVASAHAWGVRSLRDEDVRLVAVADTDADRARTLAAAFDVPHAFEDYRRLLERDDVNAVSICVPDYLHREAVVAAAAAGKHVLCEKPLALDVAGADEMIDLCSRHDVALGLVMNHRYSPDNIRVKNALRDGALGQVLMGSVLHSSALTGDPAGVSPWRGRRGMAAGVSCRRRRSIFWISYSGSQVRCAPSRPGRRLSSVTSRITKTPLPLP
jgi:predicted dehydrogenase